ncbi:MAG TPA: hypothetical protein VGB19_10415 [Actinomycetota bacterium]
MSTTIDDLQTTTAAVADAALDVDHGERTDIPITIIVAPHAGRLRILPPERFWAGHEMVEVGQAVAVVEVADDGYDLVRSPVRGRLGAVLGREGELLTRGQAIAWVDRE